MQFGLVAAREAMDQAGLPARLEGELSERTGVILGTGLGGVGTLEEGFATDITRGPDRISPFLIAYGIPNVGSGQVAISFGMTGPNFATVSACATGGHAIGEAWETIRRDDADVMLAGGSEAGIFETLVGGFAAMRALSTRNDDPEAASRPFDVERDGFVIGEGSGVVVLEELAHAQARGCGAARGARRLRRDGRRLAYHAPRAGWHRCGPGGAARHREGRRVGRRDRSRERPCDVHARGGQGGAPGDQDDPRRPRGVGACHRQQVDDRPHASAPPAHRGGLDDHDHARLVHPTRRSTFTRSTRKARG
jgi:hypothetical protein